MAAITGHGCVLALKYVSRLLVIECLDVPLDQREIFPIMFRVAARTLLAGARRDVIARMQPLPRLEKSADFIMAINTLKRRLAAESVATGTVRRSVERLMRFR